MKAVREMLKEEGVQYWMAGQKGTSDQLRACDIAIALGGDGTMLRTARVLEPFSVPLLGVNAGGLGFLSAVDLKGFKKEVKRIFSWGFVEEPRWMLAVELRRGSKTVFGPHVALNDCVIRCSDTARAVSLQVESSGRFVAAYFGDGLIISTPTGSTAYALAVGGPVVVPGVDAFLLAPICPHSLTTRPLVTPSDPPVTVRLVKKNPHDKPKGIVSLDGQREHPVAVDDDILVRRHGKPFRILLPPERSHFELLRAKLKWGER